MVEFDWDEQNAGHIWERHRVRTYEAEEALADRRSFTYRSDAEGEDRLVVVGRTFDGRLLAVVITYRGELVRVASARNTNRWETARYRRRGRK